MLDKGLRTRKRVPNACVALAIIGGMVVLISIVAPIIGLGKSKSFVLYDVVGWTRTDLGQVGFSMIAMAIFLKNTTAIKSFYSSHIKKELNAKNITLIFISSIVGMIIVEAAFRIYLYQDIKSTFETTLISRIPKDGKGNSIFDPYTGYRYRPMIEVQQTSGAQFPVSFSTNSHGHIARGEYPLEKPKNEFRIGIIGDSFTANVTNTVRWGDVLEDRLNASDQWTIRVDGKSTRVINFGLDGIGTVQFGAVAEHMAQPFQIDLLLVNVIRPDVMRRPYYRGFRPDTGIPEIKQLIDEQVLSQLPWFDLYPNALATVLKKKPRISMEKAQNLFWGERHYEKISDAVDSSVRSFSKISDLFPNAIYLIHPTYQDMGGVLDENDSSMHTKFRLAFDQFRARTDKLTWIDMGEHLPSPNTRAELDALFNVPYDQHNSDLGLTLYGNALADVLINSKSSDWFSETNGAAYNK